MRDDGTQQAPKAPRSEIGRASLTLVPSSLARNENSAMIGKGRSYEITNRLGGSNDVITHGITISLRPILRVSDPVVPCTSSPS